MPVIGLITQVWLVGGWTTPLKNMKVNWDDEIPNIWENKIDVPNHQPDDLATFVWPRPQNKGPVNSVTESQPGGWAQAQPMGITRWKLCEPSETIWNPNTGHWIGLRENLQETMIFTLEYEGFQYFFP